MTVQIRPIAAADTKRVAAFFARMPEGDRTFAKEDVLDAATVEGWTTGTTRGARYVAVEIDGSVGGYVAVLPGVGWSSHVGELRLVVDPQRRGQGLGRQLARQALLVALDLGLSKVFVEVIADQEATIEMFSKIGFEVEGLLRDHVRDRAGHVHDLIVLAHAVDDRWSALATLGIDEAVR